MVFNRLIKAPVIFIAFLFCFVQTTAFAAPKQVTLQLFWKHQFEFAGYYAAKELGFYEEAGLDVNIREYQLGMDVNEEVLSGRAQFAAVSSSVIKNYLQGKPVKLLANIFKHSALVLLSHRDAGIRTPGDLYGKRLMLTSQERNAVEFLSFFAKNGIDSKKLSYVDHNFDPMATVNGQADVMSAYITNQPFILQQKGIPYNILDPAAYGVDFYGDSLITSAKLSEQRPELVEAFKEASLMGWAYALQHPEEIIELILSKYNTTNKSREALRYEATETAKLILPETYPLGSIDPERVRHIANAMYEAGIIKDKPDIEFLIFGQELKSRLPLTQSDLALTDLTLDEQAWLATHKKIVVGGEKDWAPFDFVDKTGKYTGIANDYLKIIGEKLGIEVEVITGPSWNELLSMIRHKEIDVLPAIYHSREREDYVHYTTSYIRVTEFVFSCSDNKTISNFNDLQDKTIIVVKGYTIEGFLRSNYPEFNLITAPTIQDALKKLITGKADAFINDIISTSYHIKELSLVGIKPIAPVPFPEPTVHMAVRKDWPVLKDLIKKTLNTITESEHNAIKNHWISLAEKKIEKKLPKVTLTPDEQAWIKSHPVIRVHNEKNWPPFNYFEYGSPRGLSIDYMNLLAELLELEIEYVTGPSWNEFLGMMRSKELDVMLNIVKTEDRMKYIQYTDPYIRNPHVIISSEKHPYDTIQELFGKTVAFPQGFFYEEVLTKSFPQIKRLPVEDALSSLKAVTFGKADAALSEDAVIQALINKNMLIGLRISGEVNIGNPDLVNMRIGVRDDWQLLQSAIMKAMACITPQEMNQLRQKWIPIEMGALTAKATAPSSYGRLIIYVIAVFLILSLFVWILIKITKKQDLSVSFGSQWFRVLVLAGLSIIIIIVCLLSWFTLERNREKVLASVGESFRMILNTANDNLNIWVAQKKSFIKLFGRDPELLSITRRLLAVPPNRDSLPVSEALMDVRTFFKNNKKIFANIGFFIINPDHMNIGSMRDANVGTQNLISFQRPDLLRRAFQGEVLFVPLGNSEKTEESGKQDTQFFIGPILDLKGQIIAVMVLHADPSKDFSQALHTHGMLKNGETYAINSEGLLLSESRFNDHLRQIGLIEKGQQSALNIEICDPGVNMVEGHHPIWERSKQPLTHMAYRAIQLKLDMDKVGQHQGHSKIEVNTKACRDYRGVPVFGAWLWSADLGFGLATKIDADEALSAYHMMRITVFGILGFTLLLLVGAILFILILGERASRALIKARDNLEEKVEERTAELRENQERLALAEERSRLLLDSAGEGIFGVDTKGRINFVNPSAVSMLGYPENELIGQEVHQLVHHSHSNSSSYPLENSPIFKVYTDGTSHHEEDEVLRRKDETCFHVEYTATPMKKDGRLAGAVFTFNDTTERKQAQEALRQNMEDLERFSKLTVGREERMIKLKKEINELLRGSGKPNKYKIVT